MNILWLFLSLLVHIQLISTEIINDTQKNVTVEGYNGPMTKEILSSLKDVEILIIKSSNITKYPSHVFSRLPNLRSIVILNSHFDIMDTNIYEDADKLEEIYFARNAVPELPLTLLRHTTFERILISDQSQVKEIPKNFANETSRLKIFECSKCKIQTIQDGAFNNLVKLEVLNLHKNSIQSISKEILRPLRGLKELNLRENQIENLSTDDFPELPYLEVIDLTDNPLKEMNILGIERVAPNLKVVKIKRTQVAESVIRDHIKKTKVRFVTDLVQ